MTLVSPCAAAKSNRSRISSGAVTGRYQFANGRSPRELVGRGPRAAGERLDPQRADVLLVGAGEDRFVVVLVVVLPGDDGIQGEHHRLEVVDTVERIEDEPRVAVTRQAHVVDQPLLFGLAKRRERPVVARDLVQLLVVLEPVHLIQVDRVDAEPVQRLVELAPRALVGSLLGLTAEEDLLAVLAELRSELQLRVAVRRRHVEVVDAVVEDVFDQLVRALLFEPVERDRAERHDGAVVAGVAERASLHACAITPTRDNSCRPRADLYPARARLSVR